MSGIDWSQRALGSSDINEDPAQVIDPWARQQRQLVYVRKKRVYTREHFEKLNDRSYVEGVDNNSDGVNRTGNAPEDKYIPTYSPTYNQRLANAFIFCGEVQQGILVRAQYILGKDFSPRLTPKRTQNNQSDEEIKVLLDKAIPPPAQMALDEYIYTVENDLTDFKELLEPAVVQALVGGRAGVLIERINKENPWGFPIGTPGALKPLNFQLLGQVKIEPKTHKITRIQYNDPDFFPKEETEYFLDKNDVIYFTFSDYFVKPNEWLYGNSVIPAIMALSENNRRINEVVFPEIDENLWSGSGIFKTKGQATIDNQMMLDSLGAGRFISYDMSEIEFEQIKLDTDQVGLIAQRKENTLMILMQVRVPSMFMNFENITNRSTVEVVSEVWQNTTLEHDRDWIRRILHRDWYQPLMILKLKQTNPKINIFTLKAKMRLEFKNISFSDLPSKAHAIAELLASPGSPIDIMEAREWLGLPPFKRVIIQQGQQNTAQLEETVAQENESDQTKLEAENPNVSGDLDMKNADLANFVISRARTS
jgi:hypothetical protein